MGKEKEQMQMANKHMSKRSASLGRIYKLSKNEMPFSTAQGGKEKPKC